MNINNQHLLLLNKGFKMKFDSENQTDVKSDALKLSKLNVSNPDELLTSLEQEGKNNLAFQVLKLKRPNINIKELKDTITRNTKKSLIALPLAATILSNTSCIKEDPTVLDLPDHNTTITINQNITINVNENSTDAEILAEIIRLREVVEQMGEQISNQNATIIQLLLTNNVSLERLIELMEEANITLGDIHAALNELAQDNEQIANYLINIANKINEGLELSREQSVMLSRIFDALNRVENLVGDHKDQFVALITKVLEKMDIIIERQDQIAADQATRDAETQNILNRILLYVDDLEAGQLAILNALLATNADLSGLSALVNQIIENQDLNNLKFDSALTKLDAILAKIEAGQELDEQEVALLNQILGLLATSNSNDTTLINIGTALLDYVEQIINNQETGLQDNAEIKTILTQIAASIGNLDTNIAQVMNAILALDLNIEDLAQFIPYVQQLLAGQVLTNQQLETIINNQELQNDKLDQLTELVVINNGIAQGTQNAVLDLKNQMDARDSVYLNYLTNGQASLDQIAAAINLLNNKADSLNLSVNNVANIVGTGIAAILQKHDNLSSVVEQGFLNVLAKIPNGCTCQDSDCCERLLAKLNEILAKLNNNSNEGVTGDDVTDLEDFFS